MKNRVKKQGYIKLITKVIIIIIFILILFICFCSIRIFIECIIIKINGLSKEELELIYAPMSAIIETLLVAILASIKKTRKISVKIYNSIELKIYKLFSYSKRTNWSKNKFIYNFNNDRLLFSSSQEKAINLFLGNLKNDSRNIFYIKGNDNSGKTSTIMMLFDKCTESIDDFKRINRRCIYVSPFFGDHQISRFIKNYNYEKFKKYHLFFDDIEDLSTVHQIKIWKNLLLPFFRNDDCKAKSIVLITNNNKSVINNKIASEDKNKYIIIPIERDNENNNYCQYTFEYRDFFPQNNESVKLWVNRIIASNDSEEIIKLLLDYKNNSLKCLFLGLTILCLFSRIASIDILKSLYLSQGYTKVKFYKSLKTLVNNRFVIFFPFIKRTLYLDSDIAKLFAKRYRKEQIYGELLSTFIECYPPSGSVEKWLLSCECRVLEISKISQKESNRLFKDAFNTGNYSFLLKELVEIISSNKIKESLFYKELGYLYEKTGDRQTAIDYIRRYLEFSQDEEEKQKIYLLLFEIIHHIDQNTERLLELKKTDNLYIKLQSEYWLKHIEIEKGSFNYDELKRITNSFLQIQQYQDEINYYHILRRMFSDLARVYFLQGRINKMVFNDFRISMEKSSLSEYHSEYEDFFNLLTKAHYLHYDVIFQLGFYGRFVHDCDDKYGDNPKIEEMITTAIAEYEKCESNFISYGDKAWHTISIRKNELKVCSNIQPVKIINELKSQKDFFIESNNELHLAFVNCVLCKVTFLNLYFNPFEIELNATLLECYDLLDEAEKLYSKFENTYGLYRIYLIRAFLDLYSGIQIEDNKEATIEAFRKTISNLKEESYNREFEMINSILKYKSIKMDLIVRFFKYYPIVLQ